MHAKFRTRIVRDIALYLEQWDGLSWRTIAIRKVK
jgi:hypothetical protein